MSGAEAVTAIQLIDACIGITNTIISIGRAVHDAQGLPPKLRDLFDKIPAIEELLEIAQDNFEQRNIAKDAEDSAKPVLRQCKQALDELQEIFRKACPKDGENRSKRIWKGAKTVFFGRNSRVQGLLTVIVDNLRLLEQKEVYIIGDRLDGLCELAKSLGQDESGKYVHTGQGSIFANEGGNPTNNVASGSHSRLVVSHGSYHEAPSTTNHYYESNRHSERVQTPPSPCAIIPFRRDPDYVPRQQLIAQIHQKLDAPAGRVALVGLGGVGKSLLAIEYSYQTRERSPDTWVFWLHASNSARFAEGVQHIVDQLKIPGRNEQSANTFALLEAWLRDCRKRWLLVLDNVDHPRFLHEPPHAGESSTSKHRRTCVEYLPVCDHGTILFTSRDKNAAAALVDDADIIIVPPMDKEHAIALLEKKIRNTTQTQHDHKDRIELVQALEYIPLAVTQAGAYIRQRTPRCSVRQYLEKMRKSDRSRRSLLDRDEGNLRRDKEASNSIIVTWQISFEQIRDSRSSATDLLSLMSFCDRQGIPEFLLRAGKGNEDATQRVKRDDTVEERKERLTATDDSDSERSDDSGSLFGEGDAFDDDLVTLEGYSFISRTLDPATSDAQAGATFDAKMAGGARTSRTMERAPVVPLKMADEEASLQLASVMYNASWYAREQGMLADAEKMAKLCNRTRKKARGEVHPDTLTSMANLASTYWNQGRWGEAEELGVKVMETRKKVLGEAHPDTLTSMANLAATYSNQGRWSEAEELEVKVIETSKKVLGEAHPDTLTSMANLAATYSDQGRWGEAEELGVKVMETRKKVLGEAHPSTLTSMTNLAATYRSQERLRDAEDLEQAALALRQKSRLGR